MQLKTITLLAASLALAHAGDWNDQSSISKPVEGGDKPAPTPPVSPPKDTPEGGQKPPSGPPKDGPPKDGPKDGPTPPADKPTPPSPPKDKPTGKPHGPDGGSTPVADETASHTWSDVSSILETSTTSTHWADVTSISTPVKETSTTDPYYWGDESSVADETTTSSYIWSDITSIVPTTTSSADPHTWSDYVEPPKSTPVLGGEGKPPGKPPGKPDAPVSGGDGHGKPPAVPVSGGNGPAPPVGDSCKVVTETKVNVVTVTVHPGKPTPPAPAPPVDTVTEEHTWADVPAAPTTAPKQPSSGGYMGIIEKWRAQMGLPDLVYSSKLEANALDTAQKSGGQLKHLLNGGSMAQVLAPGGPGDFEKVCVGGWLCEMPSLPGLGAQTCAAWTPGWDHGGQTGHAKILTDSKYTQIGCGCAEEIWACDLA